MEPEVKLSHFFKGDLVDDLRLREIRRQLEDLNPNAPIFPTTMGALCLSELQLSRPISNGDRSRRSSGRYQSAGIVVE